MEMKYVSEKNKLKNLWKSLLIIKLLIIFALPTKYQESNILTL